MPSENNEIQPIIHPDDKGLFIKELNRRGFLLEDRTMKLLSEQDVLRFEDRNRVTEFRGEPVETDLIFTTGHHIFIIECKRTEFSWFFSKAYERSNVINLLYDLKNGPIRVHTRTTPDFKVAWSDVAFLFRENNRLKKTNSDSLHKSYKDVHDHVNQTLKEVEAYISEHRFPEQIIIPLIVTNAPLYFITYSKGDIDSAGNLRDFSSIEKVPIVAFNAPKLMRWDNDMQIIENDASRERDRDHMKTVFIANISELSSTIKLLIDQDPVRERDRELGL
ncbi:MAG: hypothetical protein ABIC95_02855 [archaeon]